MFQLSDNPTIDTAAKLVVVTVAMFAFVFVVMVPLYNVLCDVLGINGEKKFDRIKGETSGEFKDRAKKEILSHKLLNLAVCLNPRFSAWFVENEGDLFSYRFERLKWTDKMAMMNFLYGSDLLTPSWLELDDLSTLLKENLQIKLKLPSKRKEKVRTKLGSSYKVEDVLGNKKIIAINFKFVSF